MDLDLTSVESFVVVTEQRQFGRAAQKLGITVSALTKRIQRLEASLVVAVLLVREEGCRLHEGC